MFEISIPDIILIVLFISVLSAVILSYYRSDRTKKYIRYMYDKTDFYKKNR